MCKAFVVRDWTPTIHGCQQVIVVGRGNCIRCHTGFALTDERYHNIGVGFDKPNPDLGRYTITKKESDRGAFKTPTLRNIAASGPYFHDGSAKTLAELRRSQESTKRAEMNLR